MLESAAGQQCGTVREARGYRLIPASEAPGTGSIEGASDVEAGYGITVVPLRFVSAQTLTKLIDSFASKPGTVRADPARNLVVIQGSAVDRRAVIDTVMSFDADWMRGQSVGIYPVSNSTPEPIITELERIIDAGEGGLSQNLVKLQPIARQNAILVVTRKPELLKPSRHGSRAWTSPAVQVPASGLPNALWRRPPSCGVAERDLHRQFAAGWNLPAINSFLVEVPVASSSARPRAERHRNNRFPTTIRSGSRQLRRALCRRHWREACPVNILIGI